MASQSSGPSGARTRETSTGIMSRSAQRAANNLGIIQGYSSEGKAKKFRKEELEAFDKYYERRQYDKLADWYAGSKSEDSYIPVRMRKPLIQYDLPRTICHRVASKMVGMSTFPTFKVTDDPDTTTLVQLIVKTSKLKTKIVEPIRRMLACGSAFIRFSIIEGQFSLEHYLSKYCYPIFDAVGNLESVRIQYVFDDESDLNSKGDPTKKWFRLDLTKTSDILYDNPKCEDSGEPNFQIQAQVDHNLGYVQGEWLRTATEKHTPDGPSIFEGSTDFFDELNYSLSQTSQAIMYNQDPQLAIKGLTEDDLESLVKSSMKAWNLGREGEAKFLETDLKAVERAIEFRDKIKTAMQDVSRVVLLDPEKMVANAQSGKAMEVLHGPMLELIDEMRPELEERLSSIILKMMFALLKVNSEGQQTLINIAPTYTPPMDLNLEVTWPAIFPLTMEDLQKKVAVASAATTSNLIARETALQFIAKDFGVEDLAAEEAKIAAQPVINPFGGGF
jgi:hypothetical protein